VPKREYIKNEAGGEVSLHSWSQSERVSRLRSFAHLGITFPQIFLIWEGITVARNVGVIAKCANTDCETPFLYFRSGKLFQFPRPEKSAMESFWLCGECAQEMTLRWSHSAGVVLTPRMMKASRP